MHGRREVEGFELCLLSKSDRFANYTGEQLMCGGWFDYGARLVSLHDATELGTPVQRAEAARKTHPNWKRVLVSSLDAPMGLMSGFARTCL